MKDSTPRRFRAARHLRYVIPSAVLGAAFSLLFGVTAAVAQPAPSPDCPVGAPCYPTPGPDAPVGEAPASEAWLMPEEPPTTAPDPAAAPVPRSAPIGAPEPAAVTSPAPPMVERPVAATTVVADQASIADPAGVADRDRIADAHADRVILMPTAYTHPAGSWYFTSTEIVLLQVGYAVDDNTQVTFSGVPPLADEALFPFDLSAKHVFVRDPHVRFAAMGAVSGLLGLTEGNFVVGRLGGVVTLCTTRRCDTSFNMSSNLLLAGPATMSLNSFGAIFGIRRWAALLFEADMSVPFGGQLGEANAALLTTAFRFKGPNWSLDLGFIDRIDDDNGAIPYLSGTYRALP